LFYSSGAVWFWSGKGIQKHKNAGAENDWGGQKNHFFLQMSYFLYFYPRGYKKTLPKSLFSWEGHIFWGQATPFGFKRGERRLFSLIWPDGFSRFQFQFGSICLLAIRAKDQTQIINLGGTWAGGTCGSQNCVGFLVFFLLLLQKSFQEKFWAGKWFGIGDFPGELTGGKFGFFFPILFPGLFPGWGGIIDQMVLPWWKPFPWKVQFFCCKKMISYGGDLSFLAAVSPVVALVLGICRDSYFGGRFPNLKKKSHRKTRWDNWFSNFLQFLPCNLSLGGIFFAQRFFGKYLKNFPEV